MYGLGGNIPGIAPVALRCFPISQGSDPDIGGRASVLVGVSTASHGSKTETRINSKDITVATYNRVVICKVQN